MSSRYQCFQCGEMVPAGVGHNCATINHPRSITAGRGFGKTIMLETVAGQVFFITRAEALSLLKELEGLVK